MTSVPNNQRLPVLPLRDTVPFPNSIISVLVGRGKSIKALNKSLDTDRMIFLVAQKDPEEIEIAPHLLYNVGVNGHLLEVLHLPDGSAKVVVDSSKRLVSSEYLEKDGAIFCQATTFQEIKTSESSAAAYIRVLRDTFDRFSSLSRSVPSQVLDKVKKEEDFVLLMDIIAQNLPLQFREKQEILEEKDLVKRAELIDSLINREIEMIEIEGRIRMRVKAQLEKSNKEFYLNEQMKAIQKEMGRDDSQIHELTLLSDRIKKAKLPPLVEEKAQSELKNLKSTLLFSSEGAMIRHYIEWILALPWKKQSKVVKELSKAENILESDHYGLEKVKERIIEHLAVQIRVPKSSGSVLCLVGPPGVGKTSLAKSIARAMGRKFVRISLGGLRDEAELRGHRRTYVGSMPGRIIQSLKKVGTGNPVILLDEIDKIGNDWRGDPASALLEILDPEQNKTFHDHYLELDYDISNIMFIATANTLHISRPLLDRLEIIRISGYTEEEKLSIAEKYLIPKQRKEHLLPEEWILSNDTLIDIIRHYTRESGVRELSRMIATCARKTVKLLAEGKSVVAIDKNNLQDFLGIRKFHDDSMFKNNMVGIVCGLAWTEVGGEVLTLESVLTPGKGKVIKTGKLGDVMKESIQAAESFIKSRSERFGIDPNMWAKKDIHLHVPEGATPKDGPSAGIGMVTSIVSTLTNNPVYNDIAMTGEITLSGRVLAIGGLKEKTLAALRYGIKKVLIPKDNEKDIAELPEEVRKNLEIIPVSQIDEALEHALLYPMKSMQLNVENEHSQKRRLT